MDDLTGFVSDDHLAIEPLRELGWKVDTVSWRKQCDWSQFDLVVIRTTWDYQNSPDDFLGVLEEISQSDTRLENPLELVLWNYQKTYLRELESKGIRIVPTLWNPPQADINRFFGQLGSDELVFKPIISANGDHTYRHRQDEDHSKICEIFRERPYMVQPYLKNIVDEGEYSLFYLGTELSHTILKTPAADEFRVQEERGAQIHSARANEELRIRGDSVINALPSAPLYARVDFLRNQKGDFLLMELELIEPSMYLRMDKGAPRRFAEAISGSV